MANIFRDDLLTGKVALVTGGGSGIGQRIAERFAEHRAAVVLIGRKQDRLDAAASAIRERGGQADTAVVDVRDYDKLAGVVKAFAPIDIVVCAAAGNFPSAVKDMSANGFKAVIDIDLLGTFNTYRAAYEHLRKPGASLISISANHATQPIANQAHVCAAKAGVELLTKTLAIEWGPQGVRANCITPGPTADTEGMRRLAPGEEIQQRIVAGIPLRRYGSKEELADLALFLCSDAAAFITGAVYVCDGGQGLTRSGYIETGR